MPIHVDEPSAPTPEPRSFNQGVAYAVAEYYSLLGNDSQAHEVLGAAGIDSIQALEEAGVDEFDLNRLKPLYGIPNPDKEV